MILLIDNYDSFTYNLYDYLKVLKADVLVKRNDEIEITPALITAFDGFVISPGPCRPADTANLIELIELVHRHKPVLGICLGFQAIGEFFGAILQKAPLPVHGKTSRVEHTGHEMFAGIPKNINVCRYHSLILKDFPEELEITASTEDGTPMAFAHKYLPLYGIQYHPEAILTEFGMQVLKNWIGELKVANNI